MKIILLENIANLGNLGDVVDVKNGFARNYLIPNGKATRATKENLQEFEQRKAEYADKQAKNLAAAQERHAKINEAVYTITAKAGVDGKLFGSVTSMDIAEAVNAAGVEIKRSEVELPDGPLKVIGESKIKVRLHPEVIAEITINIVSMS